MPMTVKLSPSDFAFLFDQCKRCFYLKVVEEIARPSQPMPSIFTKIDTQQKLAFTGKLLSEINPIFPKMRIVQSDTNVQSTYIEYPELNYQQYIKGRIDSLAYLEDEDAYCIIDFKTSDSDKYQELYARQLRAYAYAFMHPMLGSPGLDKPITRAGLIIYDPKGTFETLKDGTARLNGDMVWQELPLDMVEFETFLGKLAKRLSNLKVPDADPKCPYCKRDKIMLEKYIDQTEKEEADQLVA